MESKAYRLYVPSSKQIIVSKDVQFDESKSWDWEEKPEDPKILEDVGDTEQERQNVRVEVPQDTNANPELEEEVTNNEEGEESEEEQFGASGDTREGTNGSSSRAGRNMNKPSWMKG